LAEPRRQAARRVGRQDAEQRAPSGHPCERPLQHTDEQVAPLKQLSHDKGRERAIGAELSAEQNADGFDPSEAQNVLKESWRHMQHRNRLAHERQCCR
jgi:hypothetical protein